MKIVNINLAVNYILSLEFEEDCRNNLVGFDDSGLRVYSLPCPEGEIKAWFEFSSNSVALSHNKDSIEVFDFVYQIVHILVNSMIPHRDKFDVFDLEGDEDLYLSRLSWEESLNAWFFHFEIS